MRRIALAIFCLMILPAMPARALVNPQLQPKDLYERHGVVVVGLVKEADAEAGRVRVVVARSLKGSVSPRTVIELSFGPDQRAALARGVEEGSLSAGSPVVAFARPMRRGESNRVMVYAGQWFLGRATAEDRWAIDAEDARLHDTHGQPIPSLAGTWNGETAMFVRLMDEVAAGTAYFPRKAYVRFRADVLIDTLDDRPPLGVALYDIDGDGDLDIYACSTGGDRVYLQMKPMVFVNATEWIGLETASSSVSFADVDGDGSADLLSDGAIFRGLHEGDRVRFELTEWLDEQANEDVKHAAFAELNGDGWPDVIISRAGGGIRAYLHPGTAGEAYVNATARMGLDREENGAGGDGFVTIGDWDDDGRADLFYAVGRGHLLVQNGEGVFGAIEHGVPFDFSSGEDDTGGLTGAGFVAPMVGTHRNDLVVPTEDGWRVIANRAGSPVDVTAWGNEISEGSIAHRASVAADFSLDGYVDFYTVSRAENGHNRLMLNRGYGSFMLADVHKAGERLFDGPTHTRGGWGVAAGDVDGDGAPDLLVGNQHGQLVLLLNDTPAELRPGGEHLTDDQRRLQSICFAHVRVTGPRGVVGARLTLTDANGHLVARRDLATGAAAAPGCRAPDATTLAVRTPGTYRLTVRYADGHERVHDLRLTPGPAAQLVVGR